jgi:hypothetical protein
VGRTLGANTLLAGSARGGPQRGRPLNSVVSHLHVPRFRVHLSGNGISIGGREDGVPTTDFETTRVVTARDATNAKELAIQEVLRDWTIGAQRHWHQTPRIVANEVAEVGIIGELFAAFRRTYRWH